jgi:cytidine deaminase
MTPEKLIELAKEAMTHAYAPYSGYKVGAALLCADGTVYTGCNVENGAYSACICAERTAMVKAVSEGKRRFRRIAVAARTREYCVPCGECRQMMNEFSPDMEVICMNEQGEDMTLPLSALLPHGFRLT